jgi:hypothetical protein
MVQDKTQWRSVVKTVMNFWSRLWWLISGSISCGYRLELIGPGIKSSSGLLLT